jgi:phosphate transport system permease protein
VPDIREGALRPGESPQAIRPATQSIGRRGVIDRLTRRFVVVGGLLIIASILAILLVIVVEVVPLFRSPDAKALRSPVQAQVEGRRLLAVGVDEYRELAYLVTDATVQFVSLSSGETVLEVKPEALEPARIVSVSSLGRGQFGLGLSDGRVMPVEAQFSTTFVGGKRTVEPSLAVSPPFDALSGRQITHLAFAQTQRGPLAAVVTGPRDLAVIGIKETKPLVGPPRREALRSQIAVPAAGEITQIVMDTRGDHVYLGHADGAVTSVDVSDPSTPKVVGSVAAAGTPGSGITALSLLLGDRTLLVADVEGGVSSWLILPDAPPAGLLKAHAFRSHTKPVVALAPSRRDKGFLSLDTGGAVHVNYATTGRTLLSAATGLEAATGLSFAPKGDGFLVSDGSARLALWSLRNPHPQITLQSLFGKTLYEGYREPTYAWQSTGGTDDFEEKFSLTPLIFGTLKGTFYALLIAVPVALLSAVYASQFMHPTLKGIVKPVVEIMAALPSVVLGFLAGLWLAPMIEKIVPGLLLLPFVEVAAILLALLAWRRVPLTIRRRARTGTEAFLLLPVVVLAAWAAMRLGAVLEGVLLGGDYRAWLLSTLGITYDQRNSIVVGFAMGFAVIPIIFTIAEDSLSNVPPYLSAGSLALGATRWQTALRVVLPTASPGIFSAVMIGFGRAVGETMIVLMATGNTPLMDWSMFNGFRALSANVAVELPEAPQGGSLYRVLFLAALLLFALTFIVNTAAEIVRLRLRKRYQAI